MNDKPLSSTELVSRCKVAAAYIRANRLPEMAAAVQDAADRIATLESTLSASQAALAERLPVPDADPAIVAVKMADRMYRNGFADGQAVAEKASQAEIARLREALRPFARWACELPHGNEPKCHNCVARDALTGLDAVTGEER